MPPQQSQGLAADLREERKVATQAMRSKRLEMFDRSKGTQKDRLAFREMPRPDQLLPPVLQEYTEEGLACKAGEAYPSIEIPPQFFGFDSPETMFIINLILDANNARLRRMLGKLYVRAKLKEDHYYQLIDDPSLYYRDANSSESPAFHGKAMLYLTSLGIMVFLKRTEALLAASMVSGRGTITRSKEQEEEREQRQSKRRQAQSDFAAAKEYEKKRRETFMPMFNVYAYQYATYVHCRDGDILRFQLEFLAIKRHYYDAFPFLMQLEWKPNNVAMILYRRRYYQFMTPFLDWVDTVCYLLKSCPTISVSTIYDRLINCHSDNLTLQDMMPLGHKMVECFELRRLPPKSQEMVTGKKSGMYIGRKVLRDSDMQMQMNYAKYFSGPVVRPVIPHVCSPTRRFLVHLYYGDNEKMSTLAQVLAVVESVRRMDFFSMHPLCKLSKIHQDPLVFQIYDFLWMIRKQDIAQKRKDEAPDASEFTYLRQKKWPDIKADEESLAWYLRWDVLNCISLLFGICQNALIKDLPESMIERIVQLIIEVLRCSEYLESVMSYSYFDTYFGLTTTVNCVPNLEARCVLRVLKRVPLYLVNNFSASALQSMFSSRFTQEFTKKLKVRSLSLSQISEFLITRKRKVSIEKPETIANEALGEENSRTTAGVLFCRDYDSMDTITVEVEQSMDQNKEEGTRKDQETAKHIREYRRQEIDYRYSQVFTDSYFLATGRPRLFFSEKHPYRICEEASKRVLKSHELPSPSNAGGAGNSS